MQTYSDRQVPSISLVVTLGNVLCHMILLILIHTIRKDKNTTGDREISTLVLRRLQNEK